VDQVPSVNDAEQHDDDRDHQEEVDETSERVGRDESEQPQGEEDDEDCWNHDDLLISAPVTVGFPDDTASMIPRPTATSAPMPIQTGATRLRTPACHNARPTPTIKMK
jgi:hypothetical protein